MIFGQQPVSFLDATKHHQMAYSHNAKRVKAKDEKRNATRTTAT